MRTRFWSKLTCCAAMLTAAIALVCSARAGDTRVLHFPDNQSLGSVRILLPDDWRAIAPAKGKVEVPNSARVQLVVSEDAIKDLSPLGKLADDDLYEILLGGPTVTDRTVESLAQNVKGLRSLRLAMTKVGDQGIRSASKIRFLEALTLPSETTEAALACVVSNLPNIKELTMLSRRINNRSLSRLASLQSLESLYLGGDLINDDGLAHLAGLTNLQSLTLWGETFNGRGLAYLTNLSSLRTFQATHMPTLADACMDYLASMPNLEKVLLSRDASISNTGMELLSRSHSLRWLEIDNTSVTDPGVAALMRNPRWKHLVLPTVNDETLELFRRQTNLTFLSMTAPAPGRYTERGLAELDQLQQLEDLRLANTLVTQDAMAHIVKHKSLKRLKLMACKMDDETLGNLATLRSLERLELTAAKNVTASGLTQLNTLSHLTFLECTMLASAGPMDLSGLAELRDLTIYIEYGTLGDDSIASLAKLPRLQRLQLPTTDISDRGLASLGVLTNLELLNISGNAISDHGLANLSNLKNLNSLQLRGNISAEGLRSLKALQSLAVLSITTPQSISPTAIHQLRQALGHPLQVTITPPSIRNNLKR